jgi:hypothetical protein
MLGGARSAVADTVRVDIPFFGCCIILSGTLLFTGKEPCLPATSTGRTMRLIIEFCVENSYRYHLEVAFSLSSKLLKTSKRSGVVLEIPWNRDLLQ